MLRQDVSRDKALSWNRLSSSEGQAVPWLAVPSPPPISSDRFLPLPLPMAVVGLARLAFYTDHPVSHGAHLSPCCL